MSIGGAGSESESRLVHSGGTHYAPELGMDQPLTVKARSAELNIREPTRMRQEWLRSWR